MGVATAIKRSASMTMLRAALGCMTSFRIGFSSASSIDYINAGWRADPLIP